MKKVLIPVVAASIGAAAYLYQQQEQAYNALDYIPADTIFFAGAITPKPIKDYLALASNYSNADDIAQLENLYATSENKSPAGTFLFSLLKEYQTALADPDQMVKTFGLGEKVQSYIYTIGLLPVVKIEISNPQAIWNLLDKHELESEFLHEEGTFRDITFRSYRITSPEEETQVDIIIAQKDGFLTATLSTELVSESLLAMALGFDKPTESLADSETISNIVKNHKLSQEGIGFLNHIAIIEGITATKGSLLADQLATLSEQNNSQPFEILQTQVCQEELTSIVYNWPRTVFGYTKMDITAEKATIGLSYALESKNEIILNALKSLRGFIPNYAENFESKIASVSIGLDVSNLSNSLTTIWNDLQTPAYQCFPLSIVQSQISENGKSIGMLGMATNMASGVKGISAGLFNYSIDDSSEDQPALTSLNGLIALHADNPETIFNSIKMFSSELQQIELLSNGEAIPLNEISPLDPTLKIDPQVVIKGDHLIIYNGDLGKQQAEKLGAEKLSANGLYQMSFDMKKLFAPIINIIAESGAEVPENAMMLLDYDMNADMKLDINDQGIRLDTIIKTKAIDNIQ